MTSYSYKLMVNYLHTLQQLIIDNPRVNNDLLIRVVIIKVYFVLCYKYDPIFYDFVNGICVFYIFLLCILQKFSS